MRLNQLFILSIIVVSFSSCTIFKKNTTNSKLEQPTNTSLEQKWQIIEINGKVIAEKINDKVPYVEFKNKNYHANAGCNTLNGNFTLDNNNGIKFSQGMSTMMACPGMEIEQQLSHSLISSTSYIIDEDNLMIKKGKETIVKLRLIKQNLTNVKLEGTWELDYISGPRIAFNGLYPDTKPTITFDTKKGTVSGNSSCNNYNSSFKTEGGKISFGEMMTTAMACEGSGERVFYKTLSQINTFDIQQNTSTFIMGDIAVMRFHKK